MADHLQHELKKEFQLERMILFSDAVFAIAITLLVIEIKVPPIDRHLATDEMLLNALDEMVPKFIGFILSFIIIGTYWLVHHRLFGYVVNYNRRLLILNLMFLLAIALMPFSTAFFSEYLLRSLKVPVTVYAINVVFLGLMDGLVCYYIKDPSRGLILPLQPGDILFLKLRPILMTLSYVVVAIAFLLVDLKKMIWLPVIIALLLRIIIRLYTKKTSTRKT
jgi:uncharacterized membrane protein